MEQAPHTEMTKEEDLIEITDKVDLRAYLDKKDGETYVVLRISKEGKFDAGVDMGPIINKKVVDCFDENGNVK